MQTTRVDLERIKTLRAIAIIIIGVLTGLLSGLLGIGGGVVLVPAMVYLLGMNQHQAHGTSLAVISLVVLSSAMFYGFHGEMDWLIALELAIGGVIGAAIGARLCCLSSTGRLRRYFALFLVFVAFRMLWEVLYPIFTSGSFGIINHSRAVTGPWSIPVVLLVGIGTGIMSGLLGVGGGVIMVPAMVLLLGIAQKMAQGISLAVIIPVSVSGAIVHYRHGNVRPDIGKWLAVGGILGGLVGARIALGLEPVILRGFFAVLLLTLGIVTFRRRARPD